ncbi:Retrovirus-related Pol polyprotein from transposon opus, partial [Mucuna pruriens]
MGQVARGSLRKNDTLVPAKAQPSQVHLRCFMVSERGIKVDPDKVKAIREMPPPRIDSEKFEWGTGCQEAFEKVKQYLEHPLVLIPTVPGKPLILYLTVLDESMGCMLGQQDEIGKERAIYYLSKKFTNCEKRYPTLERTCYALVWATKRLQPYMLSHTIWLVAEIDPIKYILEKPALTGRIARWQMALSEYDITYVSRHAIKGSVLADHLAYHPLVDSQPLSHEFPDEYIMLTLDVDPQFEDQWTMWFDEASNILGNRIGVVLQSPTNQYFPFATKLGFDCTNNMEKYEACTMGLAMVLEHRVKRLRVYGDSVLVIYQLCGEWETRDIKLIPYHDYVKEMTRAFDAINFHHVPREEHQIVDALATLSAMVRVNEGRKMTIHVRQQPCMAYCQHLSQETTKVDCEPWYFDIKKYLEKGEYPEGASQSSKRTLRRLAAGYLLSGSVFYKRNADMTLLRCVDRQEAEPNE